MNKYRITIEVALADGDDPLKDLSTSEERVEYVQTTEGFFLDDLCYEVVENNIVHIERLP